MKILKKEKGFTLMELLIGLSIIGIILVIIIGSFMDYKETPKKDNQKLKPSVTVEQPLKKDNSL